MTIGGIRIGEAQYKVLARIYETKEVNAKTVNVRTASSLITKGLIEMFVPDARNYAMAVRGRLRYYRLTTAGSEAFKGLKAHYKQGDDSAPVP